MKKLHLIVLAIIGAALLLVGAESAGYTDMLLRPTPGSAPANYLRIWADSTTGLVNCKQTSGSACYFAAAGAPGSVLLSVSGTLAIGSDLAPWAFLSTAQSATAVQVQVKQPPSGGSLTTVIYVGGVSWMTLTIPGGSNSVSATTAQISAAVPIAAGAPIRLDITATGSTYPGGDISAMVFF